MPPSERKHKSSDGRWEGIEHFPGRQIGEAVAAFRKLNTREARMAFADSWLAIWAHNYENVWPMVYELMRVVEQDELYKDPRRLGGLKGKPEGEFAQGFQSFQQYFEARIKRPFALWAELEQTHHYVTKFAPDLIDQTWGDARAKAAAHYRQVDKQDQENKKSDGGDHRSVEYRSRERADLFDPRRTTVDNNNKSINGGRPTGTSVAAALRRLRKDRPDIHQRILDGELTAHAGMIEAGFRKKRVRKKLSALDHLRKWWSGATADERAAFLAEISARMAA